MTPVPKEKRENGYRAEKKMPVPKECSSQQKVDTYF